jgi:serine/threonine-protein kinase
MKLPCPPELWAEFADLLDRALDVPPARRAAWLDEVVAADAPVRFWLQAALAHARRVEDEDWLEGPALPGRHGHRFEPGTRVGAYRLVRELGQGGMGEVWLAERADGAFSRQVALKLPHAHLLGGALRQRFERERDFLAGLSHPNIARFFDAGVSEAGLPWLAMEWVEGRPITEHCRSARLDLGARLRLFEQVLAAVHHAHEHFIAHRDIKPSNILVDGRGEVKLLDFGIAKLLAGEADTDATELTHQGGCAATPDYAAPEQIGGRAITSAVDVFSLGAVLFELLAGRRPFERRTDPAAAAPLPSQRVEPREAEAIGGLGAARLARALRGDLDAIVAKALEVDPARRYRSAAAFADDLRRWRVHLPIAARHVGRMQLACKFVQRRKLTSALAAGLAGVLVAGAGGIAWEGVRAQREAARARAAAGEAHAQARRAEDEARRERATREFLVSVFKFSDPRRQSDQPRGAITARELLDIGARKIEHELEAEPDTRIALLGLLADIYDELDEGERFEALLARQAELAHGRYGDADAVTLGVRLRGVEYRDDHGDHAGVQAELARLDPLITRAGLDAGAVRAYWSLLRARAQTTSPDPQAQAERVAGYQRAIALYAAAAPEDAHYPLAINNLASSYFSQGNLTETVRYARRAIEVAQGQSDRDDGGLAVAYANLGKVLSLQGDYEGAELADAESEKLALSTYGAGTWVYWHAAATHAQTVHLRGESARAMSMFQALMAQVPGPRAIFHHAIEAGVAAEVHESYAMCMLSEGRPGPALEQLRLAEQGFEHGAIQHDELSRVRGEIGRAQALLGDVVDARRLMGQAVDYFVARFPPDNPRVLDQRAAWGWFLLRQGDARAAQAQFDQLLGQAHGRRLESAALAEAGLAEIAVRQRDGAAAMQASGRALTDFGQVSGTRDIRTAQTLYLVQSEASRLNADDDAAHAWAVRALDEAERYDAPGSWQIAKAREAAARR